MVNNVSFKVDNQGITYMLEDHVEKLVAEGKATSSDGKINASEWKKTLSVLAELNKTHQPPIFKGKTDANSKDWQENYVVHSGATITFSEDEMTKLYEAMGVTLTQNADSQVITSNPAGMDSANVVKSNQNEAVKTNNNEPPRTEINKNKDDKKAAKWFKYGLIAAGVVLVGTILTIATKGKYRIKPTDANMFPEDKIDDAVKFFQKPSAVADSIDLDSIATTTSRKWKTHLRLDQVDKYPDLWQPAKKNINNSKVFKNLKNGTTIAFNEKGEAEIIERIFKENNDKIIKTIRSNAQTGQLYEATVVEKLDDYVIKTTQYGSDGKPFKPIRILDNKAGIQSFYDNKNGNLIAFTPKESLNYYDNKGYLIDDPYFFIKNIGL